MTRRQQRLAIHGVMLLVLLTTMCLTSAFLRGVWRYWNASEAIKTVEATALSQGRWLNGEWVANWSNELTEAYYEAVDAKEELQESSDVANWLYMSAYTVSGNVIRLVAIAGAIVLYVGSLWLFTQIIYFNVRYALRKTIRTYKNRRKTRQKCYK